jgi:hypothetical protein
MKKYNAYHFVIILGVIAGIISLIRSLKAPDIQTVFSTITIVIFGIIFYKYKP